MRSFSAGHQLVPVLFAAADVAADTDAFFASPLVQRDLARFDAHCKPGGSSWGGATLVSRLEARSDAYLKKAWGTEGSVVKGRCVRRREVL